MEDRGHCVSDTNTCINTEFQSMYKYGEWSAFVIVIPIIHNDYEIWDISRQFPLIALTLFIFYRYGNGSWPLLMNLRMVLPKDN
jgi:hypothetical protein